MRELTELNEEERADALRRYRVIQPFLEEQSTLKAAARERNVPYGTARRWVSRYRREGLVGLADRRRRDRNQRRTKMELQQIVEGLALQKTKPSAAAIHRQVTEIAQQEQWPVPSYSTVYDIIRSLDPALVKLAHEGTKAYRQHPGQGDGGQYPPPCPDTRRQAVGNQRHIGCHPARPCQKTAPGPTSL